MGGTENPEGAITVHMKSKSPLYAELPPQDVDVDGGVII
jgi:hypothetical protein